jgi:enamine deaminase RidA (YjgF/YER057c/UK114 family)
MTRPIDRLHELGLELPSAPAAFASYVPTCLVPIGAGRALLFIAGQVPVRDGELMTGRCRVPEDVERGRQAARRCALNILAQIESAVGLDNVIQVAQVNGWVLSGDDFRDQPRVMDACSDLMVEVLGEAGRHTRTALGTSSLPRGVTCEVNATVVVRVPA